MAGLLMYISLFLALYIFTTHFLHKIKNLPPTPFPTLPILGHLHLFKTPLHRTLSSLSSLHGPILLLRFGSRQVLLISSPSAAEECLTKNDIVFANRPRLLAGKYFGYNYTSLAWAPHGDHWRNLRRISSLQILSSHRLHILSDIRADEVKSLLRRLSRSVCTAVDMKAAFFELTLNVMMRMIAGKRYYDEDTAAAEEGARFREIVEETFALGGATNIGDFLPVMRWVGARGMEKRMRVLQEKRDEFMQGLIEEHRQKMGSDDDIDQLEKDQNQNQKKKKKTMIEVLLELQESEPQYYTDEIIRGLMLVLLGAGTDTSAGTMEWSLSLLLNNPQVLKKAQAEINQCIGTDRLVDESDISELPYLRCIINETMRMYPAGPLAVPHEASEECMVGDFRIPRGTMLLLNLWAIHNDPNIWVDPREFKPERFEGLEGSRDGFKLMPFGSGRRGCPGEGLALRMVGLALGSLIQCFDWERVSDGMIDMSEGPGLTLPKAQPLMAKCKLRPTMVKLLSPS